jgi:hypothetical protein
VLVQTIPGTWGVIGAGSVIVMSFVGLTFFGNPRVYRELIATAGLRRRL